MGEKLLKSRCLVADRWSGEEDAGSGLSDVGVMTVQ